jgi:hypothetical protein
MGEPGENSILKRSKTSRSPRVAVFLLPCRKALIIKIYVADGGAKVFCFDARAAGAVEQMGFIC